MLNKHHLEKGQALAIVLMIIALTATIAGTAAFRTVNQSRQTKEIEEQQKASNAAQGIIEKVLNDESVNTLDDFGGNIGTFNDAVDPVITKAISKSGSEGFITKVIPKDSQYIFYLQPYDFKTNSFVGLGPTTVDNLKIRFLSDGDCPVLELIYINIDNDVAKRSITKKCIDGVTREVDGSASNGLAVFDSVITKTAPDGTSVTFKKFTNIATTSGHRLLIVRPLFGPTRLSFEAGVDLPPQSEIITSQAQSGGGAQSTESVTREYPQIPDFFFATSF